MIFQVKHLIYAMLLTARTKLIIKHKALIFEQQIKVTLKMKLKVLVRYVVKILPNLNIFKHNFDVITWYFNHVIKIALDSKLFGDLSRLWFYPILGQYYSTYWNVSNIKSVVFNAKLNLCASLPTLCLLSSCIY